MHTGQIVFSQLMDFLPWNVFKDCVLRYDGERQVKHFSCSKHYRSMAFAQLSYRESLRDTVICLQSQSSKLYHMGLQGGVSRNNLSHANKERDYRIYRDFAYELIKIASSLYADEKLGLELDNAVYALDSSTIKVCLSVFDWAEFRKKRGAIKLHTLLNLQGNIPSFIHISDGKLHDLNVLDMIIIEAGAFYIMDKAYIDFSRLYRINQASAFFVVRAKKNTKTKRIYSNEKDKTSGVKYDQTVKLTGKQTVKRYPEKLRMVKYYDKEKDKELIFLTNNFTLPAKTIAELYKKRWQIELFFKWIKQHLKIKKFFGTSENAVKTQIWIAISVYVLIAIIKKRLNFEQSLYNILQILSLNIFEKIPLNQLLNFSVHKTLENEEDNQLNLLV